MLHNIFLMYRMSATASSYQRMSAIEHQRQTQDLFYHILVNGEATTLTDVCTQIRDHIVKMYGEDNMSTRLKQMLQKVCSSDDRVAKHALVFYALCQEPSIRSIFMADTPRVPPKKFQHFIEHELPVLVDKLVKGAFTSLRAFVEDVRWTYTTL